MTPAVRVAVSEAGRRADDNVPATSGYGDKWADEFVAGLHDAGYALTPLAPEVPPRRDGLRVDERPTWTEAAEVAVGLAEAVGNGSVELLTPIARHLLALAATRTPEPPDSGDGAAYQRKWGRRWNDGLWPVDERSV